MNCTHSGICECEAAKQACRESSTCESTSDLLNTEHGDTYTLLPLTYQVNNLLLRVKCNSEHSALDNTAWPSWSSCPHTPC